MRMLDVERKHSIRELQLYLTPAEVVAFRKELDRLITEPEANEHAHIFSDDRASELSFSIVTETKLRNIHKYTELEQRILTEKP